MCGQKYMASFKVRLRFWYVYTEALFIVCEIIGIEEAKVVLFKLQYAL